MTQELSPQPPCDHGNRDESGMIDVAGRAHYHWRCRDCGEEGHNISPVEASRTERSVRGAPIPGFRNLRTTTLSAEQASALASWAGSSGRTRDPGRR